MESRDALGAAVRALAGGASRDAGSTPGRRRRRLGVAGEGAGRTGVAAPTLDVEPGAVGTARAVGLAGAAGALAARAVALPALAFLGVLACKIRVGINLLLPAVYRVNHDSVMSINGS